MVDKKLTELTENTAPISTDYFMLVDDPSGSPLSQYVQGANVHKAMTAASATVASVVELATTAETLTGTDATRAVTPDGLMSGIVWKKTGTVWNPGALYDDDTQIMIFRADAAITITRIHIAGPNAAPSTELDIDLKWADDTTAWTNAAIIDVCDTTSGVVTITSGFDDATVASGKYVYWQFGADPHADWLWFWFEIYFVYD